MATTKVARTFAHFLVFPNIEKVLPRKSDVVTVGKAIVLVDDLLRLKFVDRILAEWPGPRK